VRQPLVTYLIAAAVLVGQPVGGRRVLAAPSTDAQRLRDARTHYEKAISHYNLDEMQAALEEFREAYRFKPDPSFLFNIAQCYRKLGQRDAAIDFYRKYVRASPDAANRAEAERRIAELKAQSNGAARAPGTLGSVASAPAIDLSPSSPPLPPPPASSSPVAAPSPSISLVSSPPPPNESPPYSQRWRFWVGLGVVVAAVTIGAVTLISPAPTPYAGSIPPGTVRVPPN
jgi:tetratricopeptide (TPR) repeat protein